MQIDTKEPEKELHRREIEQVFSNMNSAFSFMTIEADLYLPNIEYCTLKWLA